MAQYNPNKKLHIEIEVNSFSSMDGYTVWHIINGVRKRTMSRKADGKDFDWMTNKEFEKFSAGRQCNFTITAKDASEYFNYTY